ncbi:hypothetical protein OQA88_8347 [Cercophora sp. LCS_1]
MSIYFTHNLPHQTAPRRFSRPRALYEGLKTTVVPLLSPNCPPATTTTRLPEPRSPGPAPENAKQGIDQEMLAHFLHAFHTHPGSEGERDESGTTHPHFDLVETMTEYTIYGELPGLKREDVTVETNDLLFTITISGVLRKHVPEEVRDVPPARDLSQTKNESEEEKEKNLKEKEEKWTHWHVAERHVGRFSRAFHLPVGLEDMARVKASMSDGLLVITVPKTAAEIYREVSQERKVEVESGEK